MDGGQPFLSQKLCQIIQSDCADPPHPPLKKGEQEWVETLVRSRIIENWEAQDNPEHLRTIRDRILRNEQCTGRLLGLYQQILQQGEVAADDSPEQMELRLSGLVVKQQGSLRAYNRIYEAVFTLSWVEKELAAMRPYSQAFTAWKASNRQDESRLLRGQALQEAREWAKGKSLNTQDHEFLNASQRLETQEIQHKYEKEKQAKEILWEFVLSLHSIEPKQAQAVVDKLQQLSGDTSLSLQNIKAGSIVLVLKGSQEGFEQIALMFRNGQLTEILGIRVLDVRQRPSVARQNTSSSYLVVLKLDGDLNQQGFRVSLQIGKEGERPEIEMMGKLPPAPELATHLERHWQEKYRPLGAHRFKPKKFIYQGSVNARFQECRESARELRDRQSAWLESESFRHIDRRLREEFNRDEAIRFLIRTEDKHLQKLPWHLWDFFEDYPLAELALSPKYQPLIPLTPRNSTAKVRILAILGHSEGIDIEADRQLLENLPNAETVFLVEPQRQQINERLWEQPWDIIFFAGHSETQGETGRIYINQTDSLTIDQLRFALRKAVDWGLKLAIFNSCDGLGLARQLDDLQIPQMIMMREVVPDQVAQEFLKYFLTAYASGKKPLYLAAREARERLQGLEYQFPCASWLPMIFQNPAAVPPTWEDLLGQPSPPRSRLSLQKVLLTSVVITILVMGISMLLIWGVAKLRDDSDQQKNSFIKFLDSFELVPKK